MLKLILKNFDFYERSRDQKQNSIINNKNLNRREYKIEALLDKRKIRKRNRNKDIVIEYLVK